MIQCIAMWPITSSTQVTYLILIWQKQLSRVLPKVLGLPRAQSDPRLEILQVLWKFHKRIIRRLIRWRLRITQCKLIQTQQLIFLHQIVSSRLRMQNLLVVQLRLRKRQERQWRLATDELNLLLNSQCHQHLQLSTQFSIKINIQTDRK